MFMGDFGHIKIGVKVQVIQTIPLLLQRYGISRVKVFAIYVSHGAC